MNVHSSSRQEPLVSPQVKPGSEEARKMTVGSGRRLLESSGKRNHNSSFWRTFEDYLLLRAGWNSSRCLLKWKTAVTKQGYMYYQLSPSMHRTVEIGSGLLPTADASDRRSKNSKQQVVSNVIAMLPTPDHNCGARGTARRWKPTRPSGAHAQRPINEAISQTGQETGSKLRLQPAMCEWMMGFPQGWTDLNCPNQNIGSSV